MEERNLEELINDLFAEVINEEVLFWGACQVTADKVFKTLVHTGGKVQLVAILCS